MESHLEQISSLAAFRALSGKGEDVCQIWLRQFKNERQSDFVLKDEECVEKIRLVFENLTARFKTDDRAGCLRRNAHLAQQLGLDRAQVEGYPIGQLVREFQIFRRAVSAVLHGSSAMSFEVIREIDFFIDEAVYESVTSFSSVAQQRLAAERAFFLDAILDNLDDGIVACDKKGMITLANRASRAIFASEDSSAVSGDWARRYEFFRADGKTPLLPSELPVARALRGEKVVGAEILVRKKPSGPAVVLVCNGQPLRDSQNEIIGGVVTMHDKTREKELQESNLELDQFASVAAHDLKSPLNSITQFTELLAEEYRGRIGKDVDEYVDFIVNAGKRMRSLIDTLLEFARAGAKISCMRRLDSGAVCREAVNNLSSLVESKHATIIIAPLPWVVADADRLLQVFQNLIGNALKFGAPGRETRITVDASELPEHILFRVVDNGIGMAAEARQQAFDFLSRLGSSGRIEGSGIGLSVCRKIVEAHGGEIWIDSELGTGTTVSFTIPKERHEGTP